MAIGSPCVPRATAALVIALLLPACQASPSAAGRASRVQTPETGDNTAPPAAAPPMGVAPAPAAYVPPADPLGIPPPPPGSKTSDGGNRLARPTPVGQLAPEDAPPVGR